MLNKTIKCLLVASTFHVASSMAGVIDSEGFNTSGVNDTVATAQGLGSVSDANPLTVFGWVDSNSANDVDFFRFTVTDPSLTLFFDIDFAEDLDQTGDNDLGLDAALWIFNAAEQLIAWNDDSDFFKIGVDNEGTDPGSDQFADHDSFIGGLPLANGNYYAAVSYAGNIPDAWYQPGLTFNQLAYSGNAIFGATPDTNFPAFDPCFDLNDPTYQCTGQYQLQVRTSFNPIPEPAFFPLVGAGLLGLYLRRRFLPVQAQRA